MISKIKKIITSTFLGLAISILPNVLLVSNAHAEIGEMTVRQINNGYYQHSTDCCGNDNRMLESCCSNIKVIPGCCLEGQLGLYSSPLYNAIMPTYINARAITLVNRDNIEETVRVRSNSNTPFTMGSVLVSLDGASFDRIGDMVDVDPDGTFVIDATNQTLMFNSSVDNYEASNVIMTLM